MTRPGRLSAVFIASMAMMLGASLSARPVAAAEYTMVTVASYGVNATDGVIGVNVAITFTNTYPAGAGQVSVYNEIKVGIHDHAMAVAAQDSAGALTVSAAVANGVNVATITLRSGVQYGQTANVTLSYELHDGDDPTIRIGPHLVSFPAWGFGTQSRVTVTLPSDFEVRVSGDAMAVTVQGDDTVLDSGAIADPTHWLARVGATRQPTYTTMQQAVPLAGGTADVQVRHWADDPEWGAATMDVLVEALPQLEATFGLPYPVQRPLVVTESITGGDPGQPQANGELAVGFAEPPFTLLHQVSHVWANEELTADRWIAEGLSSWAAATVAGEMEIALPYDPAAVSANLSAQAFPLAEWSADRRSSEAESWAYAESWKLTNESVASLGADAFRTVLARMAAGLDGYEPLTTDPADATSGPRPVASRQYLDHLDAVTDQPVVEALAGPVLGATAEAELAARAAARTSYDELLVRAGDWGDPDPVRADMVAWQFEPAQTEITSAIEWLGERDVLLSEITDAGLTAPDRLEDAYQDQGGGDPAVAEIEAERVVVRAYVAVSEEVAAGVTPIQQVGLLFSASPDERLAQAATAFAAGDLRSAADTLAGLHEDLARATAAGVLRIVGLIVAIAAAGILVAVAVRRRRGGSHYTPTP